MDSWCSPFSVPVVAEIPFDDHNAPPIGVFDKFCKDAEEWLQEDPKNIVVTHCKAGKGRTGVMICAYLLFSKEMNTADEAFAFYGEARTEDRKGVTIPSQRRYVRYYDTLLKSPVPYQPVTLGLLKVELSPPPLFGDKCNPSPFRRLSLGHLSSSPPFAFK